MDGGMVLAFLLLYKVLKHHGFYRAHRTLHTPLQHQAFILLGDILFPITLLFLFHGTSPLLIPLSTFLLLGVAAYMVNDLYDIVFRLHPTFINVVTLTEFFLMVVYTLLSFLSARWLEGCLFFIVSVAKLIELMVFCFYLQRIKEE